MGECGDQKRQTVKKVVAVRCSSGHLRITKVKKRAINLWQGTGAREKAMTKKT